MNKIVTGIVVGGIITGALSVVAEERRPATVSSGLVLKLQIVKNEVRVQLYNPTSNSVDYYPGPSDYEPRLPGLLLVEARKAGRSITHNSVNRDEFWTPHLFNADAVILPRKMSQIAPGQAVSVTVSLKSLLFPLPDPEDKTQLGRGVKFRVKYIVYLDARDTSKQLKKTSEWINYAPDGR